ncbi:M24 family metallopeptidase [Leptobacterium flavescens]|uniref:M24 family metallopeptidase n=1 Tax=Leptobacterium flavescens TaxID=472055 RepID=A0A6P0UHQ3_9FLAO|nr:Xaa-Pro peptidase family protein [Leptobacterium flavescens]NER12805.1 M24 family metallopeptidase [Leptobacterium flavescens]
MNTLGIGGSTAEAELAAIKPMAHLAKPIEKEEFGNRLKKAGKLMKEKGIKAVYLHAGTNLYYFTGMKWNPSERMVGALLFPDGELCFIAPAFEKGTVLDFMLIEGEVHCWEEHESPYELFIELLKKYGVEGGEVALDEATPFFVSNGIAQLAGAYKLTDAKRVTAGCRMQKSKAEIAIMQTAMDITMEVQKAAARIMRPGISSAEVVDFINEAHIRYGATAGSYFCIVLFGVDSSFPHGVKKPKNLEENEIVLVDTGCMLHDYISDITRTYVYGEISDLQRKIWNLEKTTQMAAFEAARLGDPCAAVDIASRKVLEANGLGPDYKLPGLPHRTGHGIGLDIHEWPYMVRNDQTLLSPGMCFSNEPMICVPDEFGIRLEDHIYMTENGPEWFTQPAHSIEDPFGLLLK